MWGGATMRKILALNFDGVIHGYQSGWQGPRNIPDPPVPGALDFIINALEDFDVQIFSSRSRYFGARRAMRGWLVYWLTKTPRWSENEAKRIVLQLKFPTKKPPAHVTLDDRAITFTGTFPSRRELATFVPWNKRKST